MSEEKSRVPLDLYLPDLVRLSEAGVDYVVVAGQSVNFWARRFLSLDASLADFQPFVSKDIDLFGSPADLWKIETILSGSLHRFSDVRQSMIGVFTSNGTPPLQFDLLRTIYGPVPSKRLFERAQDVKGIAVIDPLSLLVSKSHNAVGIDQENRQDVRHVKMAVLISRAYFRLNITELGRQLTHRQLINEIKYFLGFAEDEMMRKGLALADATVADCLPLTELTAAGHQFDPLGRFMENSVLPFLSKFS